ncbi:MAG: zinc ribbon domain-containing protein [Longimicrobiales bacterium]|nr:zinc ribbon domain-containing protein [Longimicrobiales bacterium]
MSDAVLERFHRALIEEIQTQRPEYLTQPFTVAEIYQNLVPYGSHRDRIGVEMNGDYEDALVRLLAGEGGYLILDSEPALENLRAELDTPNPNTGVYREFAAVDVRLNQAYLDLSSEALDQLPDLYEELEAEDPVAMTDLAPAEGNATLEEMGVVPPGVDIFSASTAATTASGAEAAADAELDATVEASGVEAAAETGSDETEGAEGARTLDEGAGAEGNGAGPDDGGADHEAASQMESDTRGGRRREPLAPEFVEDEVTETEETTTARRTGSTPGGSCLWCRADLPERETLNFCPFCGTDTRVVPCPQCGDEVEPAWRFCASCGTEVDD